MKRLIHKKGFTLVECIVAMAVLSIMSLLLMLILNVTIQTRNKNSELERELDAAVGTLANPDGAVPETEAIGDSLDFGDFKIPGGDAEYVEANKNSYGGQSDLGIADYDFNEYFTKLPKPEELSPDISDPADNGAGETGGSYDDGLNKTTNATDTTIVNIKSEDVIDGGYHTITLTIDFKSYYDTPERSLKIILPKGSEYMGCSSYLLCDVNSSANYAVRIRPNRIPGYDLNGGGSGDNGYVEAGFDVKAVFNFKISEDDYNKYYLNPGIYFKGENVNETAENPHTASFSVTLS